MTGRSHPFAEGGERVEMRETLPLTQIVVGHRPDLISSCGGRCDHTFAVSHEFNARYESRENEKRNATQATMNAGARLGKQSAVRMPLTRLYLGSAGFSFRHIRIEISCFSTCVAVNTLHAYIKYNNNDNICIIR